MKLKTFSDQDFLSYKIDENKISTQIINEFVMNLNFIRVKLYFQHAFFLVRMSEINERKNKSSIKKRNTIGYNVEQIVRNYLYY